MNKKIAIFPGQGFQKVGMGKDVYDSFEEARDIFNEADDILDLKLKNIMFEGSQELLNQTMYSQLSTFVTSMAIFYASHFKPDFVAGHSLGEYTALVAAGILSFKDALKLIKRRALLMMDCCKINKGSMMVVLGMDIDKIRKSVNEIAELWIANFNSPIQTVLSGTEEAIVKATSLLRERGAKKIVNLNLSGAFHSPFMEKANKVFVTEINNVAFKSPDVPISMNVDGNITEETSVIVDNLKGQMVSSVLWEQMMKSLKKESDIFVEIGSVGLTRLNRANSIDGSYIVNPDHIREFLEKNEYITG